MMKPVPASAGLLGSYSESLAWWATTERADTKAILGLRQYGGALFLYLAAVGKVGSRELMEPPTLVFSANRFSPSSCSKQ